MATTTTTTAQVIKEVISPGFIDAVYRNNDLLPIMPPPVPSGGDTTYDWKLNSAGNSSSQIFTEGQVAPASGNQSWVSAAVDYTHFRIMVTITGHARAALRSNYVDAIREEFVLGQQDLVDLITRTYMSGTNGIETAVDSTTAYAGITRGSASYFESLETAVSGNLAATDLEDLIEGLADNDRGANTGAMRFMVPWNQATNIYRLTGVPATQFISDADKVPNFLSQTFAGMPIARLGDWTDTVIILADMTPGNWVVVEHEPFMVHDQGRSADADVFMETFRGGIMCKQPKMQGKLTGITA